MQGLLQQQHRADLEEARHPTQEALSSSKELQHRSSFKKAAHCRDTGNSFDFTKAEILSHESRWIVR